MKAFVPAGFRRLNDVFVNDEDASLLQRHGLDRLEAFFDVPGDRQLSKPGLAPWRQRRRLDLEDQSGRGRSYFLKLFARPPWWRRCRWLLQDAAEPDGVREAINALALQQAGVRTVRVAAFGRRSTGPPQRDSFVLLAALKGESLERWWPVHGRLLYSSEHRRQRLRLIDELAGLVARFHNAGYVHRDLYFSHVFISEDAPAGERFSLIDLGRVFRPRLRRERWVVKDLGELDFSARMGGVRRGDRLRFLRTYLRACASGPELQWDPENQVRVPLAAGPPVHGQVRPEADPWHPFSGWVIRKLSRKVSAKSRSIAAHHRRRHGSPRTDQFRLKGGPVA